MKAAQWLFATPLVFVALQSCSPDEVPSKGGVFTFDSFSKTDSLSMVSAMIETTGRYFEMYINEDVIILEKAHGDHVLEIFNKESGEKMVELLKFGRGPGEVVGVASIWEDTNGLFFVYDVTTGKILQLPPFNSTSSGLQPNVIAQLEGPFKNMYSIVPGLAEETLMALSFTLGDARIYTFDYHLDSLSSIGKLPERGKDWPGEEFTPYYDVNSIASKGWLKRHPQQNWAVVAEQYRDAFSIYKDGELTASLFGPNDNEPVILFDEVGDGMYHAEQSYKANFTYVGVSTSEERIYLTYTNSSPLNQNCQDILVFDWEGNPVAHLVLPYSVIPVYVYENESGIVEIWGAHPENGNYVQFKSAIFQ